MPTPTFAVPVLAYVGLKTQTTGGEVLHKGYTRRPALFDYMADGASIANATTVQWTVATAPWGMITDVLVWSMPTQGTGTLIGSFPALAPIVFVDRGDIPRIQAGDIAMTTAGEARAFGTGGFGTMGYGSTLLRVPIGSGIGTPYGMGPYGFGPYATSFRGVPIELTFDATGHICAPGTWTMNPYFQRAA